MNFEELTQHDMLQAIEIIKTVCRHSETCEGACPYYSLVKNECIFIQSNPEDIVLRTENDVWRAVN